MEPVSEAELSPSLQISPSVTQIEQQGQLQASVGRTVSVPGMENGIYSIEQIYGAQKPMVCGQSVAAAGKLAERPNLQIMWENYLYDRPEGIWGEIGGMVEVNGTLPLDQGRWTNACSVRVSHMLNKAGHKLPRQSLKTVSGDTGDQYFYRVTDLERYLREAFGAPDYEVTDGSANANTLPTVPGLLVMDFPGSSFTGHTTIWNGAGAVDGADIGGHRVMFWALPCFEPPARTARRIAAR